MNTDKREKKELNILIGQRLKTARENSGYTQETFAETLEIGVEHYRKLESGSYGLQPERKRCVLRADAGIYEAVDDKPIKTETSEMYENRSGRFFYASCSV